METFKKLLIVVIVLFLTSCASVAKFPISTVTPAADITATMKKDKNQNFAIEVVAKNMASPDRLTPPKNNYSIWGVTEDDRTINIGQLINKNTKKSYLITTIPFNIKEIFITAEEHGNVTYPAGIEVSRARFSK